MTTDYYPELLGSRLLYDTDRVGIEADDTPVTDWSPSDKIIIAFQIGYNNKDTLASAYKVQWENNTDDPDTWNDLSGSGQIAYAASSDVLVDETAVTSTTRRCTAAVGMTWQDGLESVNDNAIPDSGTFDLGDDSYTEFQISLDPASATAAKTYRFRLYNNTEGAALDAAAATLTITVGVTPIEETVTDNYESDPSDEGSALSKSLGNASDDYEGVFDDAVEAIYKYFVYPTDDYESVPSEAIASIFKYLAAISDDYGALLSDTVTKIHYGIGALIQEAVTKDLVELANPISKTATDTYESLLAEAVEALKAFLAEPSDAYQSELVDSVNALYVYLAEVTDAYESVPDDTAAALQTYLGQVSSEAESLYSDTIIALQKGLALPVDAYESVPSDTVDAFFKYFAEITDEYEDLYDDTVDAEFGAGTIGKTATDTYEDVIEDGVEGFFKYYATATDDYESVIADFVTALQVMFKEADDEYETLPSDTASALNKYLGTPLDDYENLYADSATALQKNLGSASDDYDSLWLDNIFAQFKYFAEAQDQYEDNPAEDVEGFFKYFAEAIDDYENVVDDTVLGHSTLFAIATDDAILDWLEEVFKSLGANSIELYPDDSLGALYNDNVNGFFVYYASVSDDFETVANDIVNALKRLNAPNAEDVYGLVITDTAGAATTVPVSATDSYSISDDVYGLNKLNAILTDSQGALYDDTVSSLGRGSFEVSDNLSSLYNDVANLIAPGRVIATDDAFSNWLENVVKSITFIATPINVVIGDSWGDLYREVLTSAGVTTIHLAISLADNSSNLCNVDSNRSNILTIRDTLIAPHQ